MDRVRSVKDLLAGIAFVGFGLAFGYASLGYELGTGLRMGPGYFPLVLAGILLLFGVIIIIQGLVARGEETPIGPVPWSGLVLILGALVFFGATVRGLGLAPALFITTALSAFASRRNGLLQAVLIAAAMTLICFAIFVWGLGLPLRAFGPWLNL